MKLTTKGRYAVTAMLDVALHQEKAAVALADIAMRQDISQSYLEQLFSKLRRRGLVMSHRGALGGYRLAKTTAEITVADIIDAIDEPMDTTRCAGARNCHKGERCVTHHLWMDLNGVISTFLQGVSLASLMQSMNPVIEGIPHEQL